MISITFSQNMNAYGKRAKIIETNKGLGWTIFSWLEWEIIYGTFLLEKKSTNKLKFYIFLLLTNPGKFDNIHNTKQHT